MKPRIKTAVLPLYTIQAVLFYLLYARRHGSCDVLHSFDRPFASAAAWILKEITGTPHVVSVRGLMAPRYPSRKSLRTRLKNYFVRNSLVPLIKLSIKSSDHIITKANYQKEYIEEQLGVSGIPITTLATGVDYSKFDPKTTNDQEEIPGIEFDENTNTVLYLGKIKPEKGADKFIQHAIEGEFEDDVRFLLVGEFQDEQFKAEMVDYIERSENGNRITIHADRVPFEKIPVLLSKVDAVSLLSEPMVEGVPRVLQEACVMETPIIASRVEGIEYEFQNHTGCFLIDRESTSEFQEAVEKSKQPIVDREEFKHKFDMDYNYARYADVYESVIR